MPTISLEVEVSQEAFDAGCVEMFAGAYGWTPTIKDEDQEEIINPVSSMDFSKEQIKKYVREVVTAEYLKGKLAIATEQAKAEIGAIV